MADVAAFTVREFQCFLLILFRVSGIMVTAPLFGGRAIPTQVKAALSLVLSMILFPIVDRGPVPLPENLAILALAVAIELMVGLAIGFVGVVIFAGFQIAGFIVDQEIGISMANVFDPITASQISVLGQLKFMLGILVFVILEGHLWLLAILAGSFKVIPLVSASVSEDLWKHLLQGLPAEMFEAAIKIAAPALVALIMATVAMAFAARILPEMNIFILGFPLRIVLGFCMTLVAIPVIVIVMGEYVDKAIGHMERVVRTLGGV